MCGLFLQANGGIREIGRIIRTGIMAVGIAGVAFLLSLGRASADPTPQAEPISTVIKADHMLAENIQNEIHFVGHVHLVKKGLLLKADSLDVERFSCVRDPISLFYVNMPPFAIVLD